MKRTLVLALAAFVAYLAIAAGMIVGAPPASAHSPEHIHNSCRKTLVDEYQPDCARWIRADGTIIRGPWTQYKNEAPLSWLCSVGDYRGINGGAFTFRWYHPSGTPQIVYCNSPTYAGLGWDLWQYIFPNN